MRLVWYFLRERSAPKPERPEDFTMKWLVALALLTLASLALIAQESHGPITNTNVLSMAKSGLAESTIVLAIEHGPVISIPLPKH